MDEYEDRGPEVSLRWVAGVAEAGWRRASAVLRLTGRMDFRQGGRLAQGERRPAVSRGSGKAVHGQDGRVIPIIEPEARPGPLIGRTDQSPLEAEEKHPASKPGDIHKTQYPPLGRVWMPARLFPSGGKG